MSKELIEKEFGAFNFKPLPSNSFILNHKFELKNGLRVSVSCTSSGGMVSYSPFAWYVGEEGSFEIAIMREEDLLTIPKYTGTSNIRNHVSYEELYEILKYAEAIEYRCVDIFVYDMTDKNHELHWSKRFSGIKGVDADEKIAYAKGVWGEDKVRVEYL